MPASSTGRRRRRHLVLEPLSRRALGHRELGLLLQLRQGSLSDWKWSERYPRQPEILSYLEHVADRFDLRKNLILSTTVTKAHFNEATNRWDVETDKGDRISASS